MNMSYFGKDVKPEDVTLFLYPEYIFMLDLVYNFFIEYYPGSSAKPVRDFRKVSMHYI
jgi:hypothetical protein